MPSKAHDPLQSKKNTRENAPRLSLNNPSAPNPHDNSLFTQMASHEKQEVTELLDLTLISLHLLQNGS